MKHYSRWVGMMWVALGIYRVVIAVAVSHEPFVDCVAAGVPMVVGWWLMDRHAVVWWLVLILSSLFAGLCAVGVVLACAHGESAQMLRHPTLPIVLVVVALTIAGLLLDRPSKWPRPLAES